MVSVASAAAWLISHPPSIRHDWLSIPALASVVVDVVRPTLDSTRPIDSILCRCYVVCFFGWQVALDRAAHLMDAVAFGHKDWDGVREELAEVRILVKK